MRDLYKTLQLCATEDAMDYCPEFDDVKSALEYCNKNVKPFAKFAFRSGNECVVNELTRRLQEIFVERQLIDPDDQTPLPEAHQKLRKLLMFLFVNTDTIYKYNLREDSNFVHVIDICPLIPKFLTITLIWELQLDNFFYEALTYTPCWFAFQYFEAANESLKYIDDAKKELNIIEQLLRALLINIERSRELPMDFVDQKTIYNKLYEQATILFRRFNTPDANKIESMKKRQLHRYNGIKAKHLLQMTLFAFDLYESKYQLSPNFDVSVYKIGQCFHKQNEKVIHNVTAKEEERRIINALLGTLENCVMSVQMADFIEWVEVDLTPTLTLQQAVGEMAFRVREKINASAIFEHNVETILKSIEIAPKPIEEVIAEANIGQILCSLDNSADMTYDEKKLWFDELFKRGEATLGNDECLQTISNHVKLVTTKNCEQMMDYIKLKQQCAGIMSNEHDDNDDDDDEYDVDCDELIRLLHQCIALKRFDNQCLLDLLVYQQKVFGELCDGISNNPTNFEQRATEFLNKCTTVFDLHEYLLLCFEHPIQMWTKFFNSACHASEHVRHFIEAVRKALPYSHTIVDHVLKQAIVNPTQPVYFPELLCELYFLLYRDEHKVSFLAKFINGHMKSCLDAEDYDALLPIVKALNLITQRGEASNFDELTAPMLAMVAVVADLARWNLNTFSNVRVELVGLCINFIKVTLNKFLAVATDKDRKWLSSKIDTTCMSLTQFYFQNLCQKEKDVLSFDRYLYTEDSHDKAVKFLQKFAVRCTSAEFKCLANSPHLSPYISEAMQQLSANVNSKATPNAILNLRYCLAEYMNIVNDVLKLKCENGSQTYELLYSILKLIATVPNEIYDQVFMETESLLKELLKNASEQLNKDKLTELLEFVSKMPDCTAKNIFFQSLNDSIPPE